MSDHTLPLIITQSKKQQKTLLTRELRTEVIRKSIHMLIAFVPVIAQLIGRNHAAFLLLGGILLYSVAEALRLKGKSVFFISKITQLSSRKRDGERFVLAPVTLGIGAVLALSLYPEPAASVAIYALAFGDGLSSLFGKVFGSIHIPYTGGKTLEGSFTCFAAVLFSSFVVTQNFPSAVIIAVFATLLEAIPSKDFDNILLPFGTGLLASIILIA